jgi:hypothetical protein
MRVKIREWHHPEYLIEVVDSKEGIELPERLYYAYMEYQMLCRKTMLEIKEILKRNQQGV